MIRGAGSTFPSLRRRPQGIPSPLAIALGPPPGDRLPASIVGLEHEYSLSVSGARLDFRDVIHDLDIRGWRLDPGDLNAYRCPSGLVITCDAEDAEVVSPPLAVQPGFGGEVAAWAEHGRAELLRLFPAGVTVTPFSTHISASMPDGLVAAACDLFARTFAPALMLLLGGADSHGVFVRPRPGRLEVCGEHAMGGRLAASAALVAGGARACAAALRGGGSDARLLPPLLAVDLRTARGRHGLFVGRHLAFGHDLCAPGGAPLPLHDGGEIAAQEHLRLAWAAARSALGADSGDGDFHAGDAIVSGSGAVEDVVAPRSSAPVTPSPFGDLAVRRRPGFEAAPEAATWDFTVFRLSGTTRSAFACLPGSQLPAFLERLDAGALDDLLSAFLGADPTGRVLVAHDETAEAALWDDAVIGPDLLPYERSATDGVPALVLPALGPIGLAEHSVPPAYVRRGKAATVAAPPDPIAYSPISVVTPSVAETALPLVPPPVVSPPDDPRPPPPVFPAERQRRRRRRVGVLVGAVLALLVGVSAAALTGLFAGGSSTDVNILTSPASPSVSSDAIAGPSTTSPEAPSTTAPRETTTVPPVAPAVDSTVAGAAVTTLAPATRPTTAPPVASTVPVATTTATTTPVDTTVPVTTTVQATTTTTTVPPPTQLVVAVTSGILGCIFQPGSANAVQGSIVRFRNDTRGGISVSVTPPAGATTVINVDAGGTSGGYTLAAPGSYAVTCTPGGDSLVGRMTVTVTNA